MAILIEQQPQRADPSGGSGGSNTRAPLPTRRQPTQAPPPIIETGPGGDPGQPPGPGPGPGPGPLPPPLPEAPAPVGIDVPPPPPVPMPPSANLPLALPGTFARPGTQAARPFRSPAFLQGRVVGPTGPGVAVFGGTPGFGGLEQMIGDDEEEFVRRIVAGLPGGGGQVG